MTNSNQQLDSFLGHLLRSMVQRPGRVLVALAILSLVLLAVGISSLNDEDASFNPNGEEFDTEELVNRTFRPSTTELIFIVEDEGGDALDAASLREWFANSNALRTASDLSEELSTYFDDELGLTVKGTYSIADAVDDELRATGVTGGLESASDEQVKQALSSVLGEGRPTATFRDLLSVHSEMTAASVGGDSIDLWTSPAFLTQVRVDRAAFPIKREEKTDPLQRTDAEQAKIDSERDVEIEKYARDAQDVLRGDEQFYKAWGVAIDATLTDDESFTTALPFLLGAIVLIVLLVGILLRSYWAAALAGSGLAMTMLWARMLMNIAGFEQSIILTIIVPIATISFGIDFMIHAVGRCREELAEGVPHRLAYVIGIATVGGALALALSTSAVAFGSNATSGIPGVIQFGFGAAISLGCAFIMLGLLAPLFLLVIEERLSKAQLPSGKLFKRGTAGLRILAAAVFASLVIIAVIAVPFVGFVATVVYSLLFIALPLRLTGRRLSGAAATPAEALATPSTAGLSMASAGTLVAGIVRVRYVALTVIAVITAAAVLGATKVDSKTEPNDFYPSSSDLVTSVDKVLLHSESIGSGDVLLYVEGNDLAHPDSLKSAAKVVEAIGTKGSALFASNPDGSLAAPDNALDVARAAVGVDYARQKISSETGVTLTDDDGDGFPDTPEQVDAAFRFAVDNGIPASDASFVYTADEVGQLLATHDDAWATTFRFPLAGFADAAQVESARNEVEAGETELLNDANAGGRNLHTSISGAGLTFQLRIDAIKDSMVVSVPLAMVLCLILAGLVMRSVRLSLASIVPIALVIVWLLGFMYLFDYSLNIVTATITAISVGVGIDYAIHYTMRFREEMGRHSDRLDAIRTAAEGTGTALVLSAATSILGFLLLALAPMPVLAAYGLLTAVMIAFSLLAALIVLPSLLFILVPANEAIQAPIPEPRPITGGDR